MHKTFVKLGRTADFKTSGSKVQDVEVEVSGLVQALARCGGGGKGRRSVALTCQCVPIDVPVCASAAMMRVAMVVVAWRL